MRAITFLAFVAFAALCISVALFTPHAAESKPMFNEVGVQTSQWTCFKTGEVRSGQNKICYYNCLGSQVAITIGAYEQCPLNIQH